VVEARWRWQVGGLPVAINTPASRHVHAEQA
jgi:hypothetical protein